MDLKELAELVEAMRERQKHYFEVKRKDKGNWAHINSALKLSKDLEKYVDDAVKEILHPHAQVSLF